MRGVRDQSGQVLVVVVIFLTVLLGFTALAVDAGRFYSERRFLQNVADAAALAGATALTQGRSHDEVETIVRESIARNYALEPTGNVADMPPMVPLYESGHEGDGSYLAEGILIAGNHVRVALRNRVSYTFGQAVGLTSEWITARARAGNGAGLLPIAVREYLGLPGPNTGATEPCTGSGNPFVAVFATAETSCLGSTADASGREDPSIGSAFDGSDPDSDREHHGPIVEILGQGADPDNAADFRGFVALDIRNFATTTSQQFFNGVTSGTSPNTLKDIAAYWISSGGYPGPLFPSISYPPDPNDQIALMSGNSAGIAVDAVEARYAPGDEVLIIVYPGYTMTIPEFALAAPGQISLAASGTSGDVGTFKVSRNQSFSGTVDLSTLADTLDPANPMVLGAMTSGPGGPIDYQPDPVSPSMGGGTSVTMRTITTTGATPGVYALWVKGQAGEPYLQAEMGPVSVKIGTVTRQFQLLSDAAGKVATNLGDDVSFTLTLKNWPAKNTDFGGSVSLGVDGPLPGGSVAFGTTAVTPSKNGTSTTLTIHTSGMAQGTYRYTVRATGMNGDSPSRTVTMLLPLEVDVAPGESNGNDDYLDMSGYAVMRITGITSDSVSAYAITPVITDFGDSRLKRGKTARLLPW